MIKDVALIMPYFGAWPEWMSTYCKSVSFNDAITFIYLSEVQPPVLHPNMRWFPSNLNHIQKLIEDKFGLLVENMSPYKMCDLKPMYGVLFSEYLSEFQYWGFADVDIILGDVLKKVLTEASDGSFDVISTHPSRICGPLSFFRNTDEINRLYLKDDRYKVAITSKNNVIFDEQGFSDIVRSQEPRLRCLYRASHSHDLCRGLYYWKNGKVFENFTGIESGYFHFRTWKSEMKNTDEEHFYITRKGFKDAPLSMIEKFRLATKRKRANCWD